MTKISDAELLTRETFLRVLDLYAAVGDKGLAMAEAVVTLFPELSDDEALRVADVLSREMTRQGLIMSRMQPIH